MNSAEANRPIVARFFEALDALATMSKIKSIRAFCTCLLYTSDAADD